MMIRLLQLSTAVFITSTSICGTEYLAQRGKDSRLVFTKRGLVSANLRLQWKLPFRNKDRGGATICRMHCFSKGSLTELAGQDAFPNQNELKIERVCKGISLENTGRYSCKTNDADIGSHVSTSLLLGVQSSTNRAKSATASKEKRVVLRCTKIERIKLCLVLWLCEGNESGSDSDFQIKYREHTWFTASPASSRTYTCRLVTVHCPEELLKVLGSSEPDVTWELNRIPVNMSHFTSSQEKYSQPSPIKLTVSNVPQGTDNGLYSCCMHTNHGGKGTMSCHSAYSEIQGTYAVRFYSLGDQTN
jgi:hypothetical protein